jgi:putative heme-binding domain-containing protein
MKYLVIVFAGLLSAQDPPPDLAQGKRIFESQCTLCHGQDGRGGRGPSLARPRLKNAPDDKALGEVIQNGVPNTEMPGAWQLHPREVVSVAAYVRSLGTVAQEVLPGDAARGGRVYQEKGCAGCHIVSGQGGGYGPDLTETGAKRSAAYLRESVLKPGAGLPDNFLMVEAVAGDGRVTRGIRVNEDSFTIQIKDSNQRFHTFRKGGLKELRRLFDQSPMPSYDKQLSQPELDDLVAYLASLRGKS